MAHFSKCAAFVAFLGSFLLNPCNGLIRGHARGRDALITDTMTKVGGESIDWSIDARQLTAPAPTPTSPTSPTAEDEDAPSAPTAEAKPKPIISRSNSKKTTPKLDPVASDLIMPTKPKAKPTIPKLKPITPKLTMPTMPKVKPTIPKVMPSMPKVKPITPKLKPVMPKPKFLEASCPKKVPNKQQPCPSNPPEECTYGKTCCGKPWGLNFISCTCTEAENGGKSYFKCRKLDVKVPDCPEGCAPTIGRKPRTYKPFSKKLLAPGCPATFEPDATKPAMCTRNAKCAYGKISSKCSGDSTKKMKKVPKFTCTCKEGMPIMCQSLPPDTKCDTDKMPHLKPHDGKNDKRCPKSLKLPFQKSKCRGNHKCAYGTQEYTLCTPEKLSAPLYKCACESRKFNCDKYVPPQPRCAKPKPEPTITKDDADEDEDEEESCPEEKNIDGFKCVEKMECIYGTEFRSFCGEEKTFPKTCCQCRANGTLSCAKCTIPAPDCAKKDPRKRWPELVGKKCRLAKKVIKRSFPEAKKIQCLKPDAPWTDDEQLDRVRIAVNKKKRVIRIPTNG